MTAAKTLEIDEGEDPGGCVQVDDVADHAPVMPGTGLHPTVPSSDSARTLVMADTWTMTKPDRAPTSADPSPAPLPNP